MPPQAKPGQYPSSAVYAGNRDAAGVLRVAGDSAHSVSVAYQKPRIPHRSEWRCHMAKKPAKPKKPQKPQQKQPKKPKKGK